MIKKLYVLLFSLIPLFVIGQESTVKWNYPVRYGTEKWEQLNSFSERLDAFNIPDSLLEQMSTKDLAETCLKFPYWILITSRNNNQEGYNFIKSKFNGFRELEKREGAFFELVKIYEKMSPIEILNHNTLEKQGIYSFQFTYIETLISQPDILKNIKNEDYKNLLRKSTSVYDAKKELMKEYSFYGLSSTCLIMARILEIRKSEEYLQLKNDYSEFNRFILEGNTGKQELLEQIAIESKRFLQKQ